MREGPRPLVGILCTMLALLLLVATFTFAAPCGVHEDGSANVCVQAARAVRGVAVMALVLSLVRIFELDEGERRGLDLGIALAGVLAANMPTNLVALCPSPAMPCQMAMAPICAAIGTLLGLVAAADLIRRLLALRAPR